MAGRHISLSIILILLAPFALAGTQDRLWQEGELLSRKTVPVGRTYVRKQYVYRVRGSNCRYLVVSDTALQLDLFVPMKFSTDHRRIFIQDADGKERVAQILQRATFPHRR
jgi:hypothetical protein